MATLRIADAHCADKKMEADHTALGCTALKKQYINRLSRYEVTMNRLTDYGET